jgi:hypothetical protein
VAAAPDQRRLQLYLLGLLPAGEAEQMESLYFQDGPVFDALVLAEDELIDAYVGGRLAPDDRSGFEAAFLASPDRRERVEFARALQRAASGSLRGAARGRTRVLLAAAAVAVCLAGAAFVAFRLHAASQTELQASRAELRALQGQVRTLRETGARLAEELAAAARPAAGVVTWIPAPELTRSASPTRPLVLGPGSEWVRLRLPVDRSAAVALEVQTPEGRVAWTQPALPGVPPTLDAMVPARALPPGTYLVLLKAANGSELAAFPLRVAAAMIPRNVSEPPATPR